jgi:formylglycine-generating enzyme required for sulfatase activity
MKKIIFILNVVLLTASADIFAATIGFGYVGFVTLRGERPLDLFAMDNEGLFHGGGLHRLSPAKMAELPGKLTDSIKRNVAKDRTPLYAGLDKAIELLEAHDVSNIPGAVYKIVVFSDGDDTVSVTRNHLGLIHDKIESGIRGKKLEVMTIGVGGKTGKAIRHGIMKYLATDDGYLNLNDDNLEERLGSFIMPAAADEMPLLVFVIDQSQSLGNHQTVINKAVESAVRELFRDNLVLVPGGDVWIGSDTTEPGRDEDELRHRVHIDPFWVSPYELTQAEFELAWGGNPDSHESEVRDGTLPVTNVSFFDVCEVLNRMSEDAGLTPVYTFKRDAEGTIIDVFWDRNANGYRLLTEAEWEYAARAGTTTAFNTGASISTGQANFKGTAPRAPGSFNANALGLFDCHGNVKEMCWDYYNSYSVTGDDGGESVGKERVNRGGSFANYEASEIRSAYRAFDLPTTKSPFLGVRVARNAE